MTEPLIYTVSEVAQILRVSDSHVRKLARTGVLPTVPHMGRRILIPRVALEAFIASWAG